MEHLKEPVVTLVITDCEVALNIELVVKFPELIFKSLACIAKAGRLKKYINKANKQGQDGRGG